MNWLMFEVFVADMADNEKIKSASELEALADNLHTHIEIALQDYADDNDFGDDYMALY